MLNSRKSIIVAAAFLTLLVIIRNVWSQPYEISPVTTQGISFDKITVGEDSLFYAYSGNPEKVGLLFIHGTPGGWGAFEHYLANARLQNDFFMVSIDRLGWGNSPIPGKRINGEFAPQSNSVGQLLNRYPNKKWILVGHSLGASIAPKVALDFPGNVGGLLLLAGSLKPSLGGPRWYNRAASTWLVASMIGKTMKYSNREIMGLRKQLKAMDEELKSRKLYSHVTVLQGMKDKLVSPKNAAYVEEAWQNSFASLEVIALENEGHFLPWRQSPLVVELIYKLANKF